MTLPSAVKIAPVLDQAWVEVANCPICESPNSRPFESVRLEAERVGYQLCGNCGAVYQSPRMSDERLETYYVSDYLLMHQHAEGITEKELRVQAGRARHLIGFMRGQVVSVRRHMDIGSSTGKLMQAVSAAYGCVSAGVEPGEAYRAYSAALGLRVYAMLGAAADAGESRFDLITLAHVLEHLPDPVGYLRDLRERWLTSEGSLILEVPNLYGHFSLERPHLQAFHAATLRRTLAAAGFETRRIVRHGSPRSRLIPLYLTASASSSEGAAVGRNRSSARGVRFRRKAGMAWHTLATRVLPRWAWLPLPPL